MKISDKIKKLRAEKGWSQAQLALKLGVHSQHISRYERGVFAPSAEALAKLAEIFGVSTDYLLSDDTTDSATLKVKDKQLKKYFEELDNLSEEDKNLVKGLIEAVLIKSKVRDLASEKKF